MAEKRSAKIIELQSYPGGVAQGIRSRLFAGRYEIVTAGKDPSLGFIGGDPFKTNVFTGLDVPATTSASIGDARYLFMLARAQFNSGEQGVRLVGIRQYAELIARVTSEDGPTQVFRKEILSPMFRPPDGNISWHVMIIPKTARDRRNPANADSFVYQDSYSPALLFQTTSPYSPPNGGRPWGTAIGASLGNIHELRYPWQKDFTEYAIDIPIPLPCDVALFASVRQNDPSTNPTGTGLTAQQIAALDPEEQFLVAFHDVAQYGRIAGSLVFDQNLGEDVP